MYLFNIISYDEALSDKRRDSQSDIVSRGSSKKIEVSRELMKRCAIFGLAGLVITCALYYFEIFPKDAETVTQV